MTIGIATSGKRAGMAAIEALAAVERIGTGAIGGFVSLAVMDGEGGIHRAETQVGGTGSLPTAPIADALEHARLAVLMSSGPDRPAPLSQFTPARAGIGLVTGHRLPNVRGLSGLALNEDVLARMMAGIPADLALRQVLDENPLADAGMIVLTSAGEIALGNTAYVGRFSDAGTAHLRSEFDPAVQAAVLHNAIEPSNGLALVAARLALNVMEPPHLADDAVELASGSSITGGDRNEIRIDGDRTLIALENRAYLIGAWDLGLGPRVPVVRDGQLAAICVYEPYLTIADGKLCSIDGQVRQSVPVRRV